MNRLPYFQNPWLWIQLYKYFGEFIWKKGFKEYLWSTQQPLATERRGSPGFQEPLLDATFISSKDLLLSSSVLLQPKEERKSFNPCSSVPAVSILSMVATDNGEHAKFLWKPSLASLRRACFTISKLKSMVLVGNKDGLFVLGSYYDFELANIYFVTETGKAM